MPSILRPCALPTSSPPGALAVPLLLALYGLDSYKLGGRVALRARPRELVMRVGLDQHKDIEVRGRQVIFWQSWIGILEDVGLRQLSPVADKGSSLGSREAGEYRPSPWNISISMHAPAANCRHGLTNFSPRLGLSSTNEAAPIGEGRKSGDPTLL